jgi:hypothetical protein
VQYAAVMGIKTDLKLTGNEFSNTATWFFIAYLIAEVPNGEPLLHFPCKISANHCQSIVCRKSLLPNGSGVTSFSGESLPLRQPVLTTIAVSWPPECFSVSSRQLLAHR